MPTLATFVELFDCNGLKPVEELVAISMELNSPFQDSLFVYMLSDSGVIIA